MLSLFLRVILLATLLICALVRLNGFSLFYLVCFFVATSLIWEPATLDDTRPPESSQLPNEPGRHPPTAQWSLHDGPSAGNSNSDPTFIVASVSPPPAVDARFRRVLVFVLLSSLAILLAIAAFHIAGAASSSVDGSSTWYVAIGLQTRSPSSTSHTALLFVPDLVLFLVAAVLLLTLRRAHRTAAAAHGPPPPPAALNGQVPVPRATLPSRFSFPLLSWGERSSSAPSDPTHDGQAGVGTGHGAAQRGRWVWVQLDTHYTLLHFVAFVLLLFVGVVDLSVLSLVYYLTWIFILALWSLSRPDPSLAVPTLSRSPSQSIVDDSVQVESLMRPAPSEDGEPSATGPLRRQWSVSDSGGRGAGSRSRLGSPALTRNPSTLSLHPIPDVDEKAEEEEEEGGDDEESINSPVVHDEAEAEQKGGVHATATRTDSFFNSPRNGRPLLHTDGSAGGPPAGPGSGWHWYTSTVFTLDRLHRFYRLLAYYSALDFVVRYVYRLLYHYDGDDSSLRHVGFYTGVDGTSASVGLGVEYALILILYGWVQTLVQFHGRYLCLPAVLFPSLRAEQHRLASPSDTFVLMSPASQASSGGSSPTTSASSPARRGRAEAYTPPAVYYKVSRFVIGYSFILIPVVTFCLALYYDILPAVAFLGVMALSLLLPSPLSLLLAPVTLALLALFNLVLYSLYLPSSYWTLSSFTIVDHPWWQESVFALLIVSSVAMMYVGFVVKYKVRVFHSLSDLLVWRDVEREQREEEREIRQKADKEKRIRKREAAREADHQRALREAQTLQEEEEWEAEWSRLKADALSPSSASSQPHKRKETKTHFWSPYTSRVGRLKLRFQVAAVVRSSWSWLVESVLLLWRLLYLNADLFAIILLYIVGVMETDVLHSVAILLFIVYAISHSARQSPFVLVVYSCVVILLLFIFQFDPLANDVSRPTFQRAGFIGFGSGYESVPPLPSHPALLSARANADAASVMLSCVGSCGLLSVC